MSWLMSASVRAEFAARRLWSAVRDALRERATGFSDYEAGDYLDAEFVRASEEASRRAGEEFADGLRPDVASTERVFDATDRDAIAVLKIDPDAYFQITRKFPRQCQERRNAFANVISEHQVQSHKADPPSTPDTPDLNGDPEVEAALAACEPEAQLMRKAAAVITSLQDGGPVTEACYVKTIAPIVDALYLRAATNE